MWVAVTLNVWSPCLALLALLLAFAAVTTALRLWEMSGDVMLADHIFAR